MQVTRTESAQRVVNDKKNQESRHKKVEQKKKAQDDIGYLDTVCFALAYSFSVLSLFDTGDFYGNLLRKRIFPYETGFGNLCCSSHGLLNLTP